MSFYQPPQVYQPQYQPQPQYGDPRPSNTGIVILLVFLFGILIAGSIVALIYLTKPPADKTSSSTTIKTEGSKNGSGGGKGGEDEDESEDEDDEEIKEDNDGEDESKTSPKPLVITSTDETMDIDPGVASNFSINFRGETGWNEEIAENTCGKNSYVYGLEISGNDSEPDRAGVAGITLLCRDLKGEEGGTNPKDVLVKDIKDYDYKEGNKTLRKQCKQHQYLSGIHVRGRERDGSWPGSDDVGISAIGLRCNSFKTGRLEDEVAGYPEGNVSLEGPEDGREFYELKGTNNCDDGYFVEGLKVRYEGNTGDDVGIFGTILKCRQFDSVYRKAKLNQK